MTLEKFNDKVVLHPNKILLIDKPYIQVKEQMRNLNISAVTATKSEDL